MAGTNPGIAAANMAAQRTLVAGSPYPVSATHRATSAQPYQQPSRFDLVALPSSALGAATAFAATLFSATPAGALIDYSASSEGMHASSIGSWVLVGSAVIVGGLSVRLIGEGIKARDQSIIVVGSTAFALCALPIGLGIAQIVG